jgi:hypothetical protein
MGEQVLPHLPPSLTNVEIKLACLVCRGFEGSVQSNDHRHHGNQHLEAIMTTKKLDLSLISSGRSSGFSYTKAEHALALAIGAVVLTAAGVGEYTKHGTDEAVAAVNEIAATMSADLAEANKGLPAAQHKQLSVPGLCRAAYRKLEAAKLADKSSKADFPKTKGKGKDKERIARDHTSVGLLFRKGFKELGVPESTIDIAFPSPYKTKVA